MGLARARPLERVAAVRRRRRLPRHPAVLAAPPVDVVSTFVTGDDRFVGAITAVHDDDAIRLRDDPFATIFPATLVRVGPGLLGTTPAPVGPVIQRYGGANPWPWDRFGEQRRADG